MQCHFPVSEKSAGFARSFFSTGFAESFRPEQYKAIQPSIQPCPQEGPWERG